MEQIKSSQDVLEYLKSLLEGSNSIHANRWLTHNESALQKILNRSDYLRLKFEPIKFSRNFLAENSVDYVENAPHTKYENFLLSFADEALQEDGSLRHDWYLKIFDGILCSFINGNQENSRKNIFGYLKRHQGERDFIDEKTVDLIFFAESIKSQDGDLAKFLVSAVDDYLKERGLFFSEIESAKKEIFSQE